MGFAWWYCVTCKDGVRTGAKKKLIKMHRSYTFLIIRKFFNYKYTLVTIFQFIIFWNNQFYQASNKLHTYRHRHTCKHICGARNLTIYRILHLEYRNCINKCNLLYFKYNFINALGFQVPADPPSHP